MSRLSSLRRDKLPRMDNDSCGDSEEIRTPNLLIRSQMLYPIELQSRFACFAKRLQR